MADTKDLIAKRKEAYEFIKHSFHQPPFSFPPNISFSRLANALGGIPGLLSSLHSLQTGKANPTELLVEQFKDEFKQLIAESEIKQYLIDPFKKE